MRVLCLFFALLTWSHLADGAPIRPVSDKPNVVLIVADDLVETESPPWRRGRPVGFRRREGDLLDAPGE